MGEECRASSKDTAISGVVPLARRPVLQLMGGFFHCPLRNWYSHTTQCGTALSSAGMAPALTGGGVGLLDSLMLFLFLVILSFFVETLILGRPFRACT
jgi:hypothetical protein